MKEKIISYNTLKENLTILVHVVLYSILLWFAKDILESTTSLIHFIFITALLYLTTIIAWDLFGKYEVQIKSKYLILNKILLGLKFSSRKIFLGDVINSQILTNHNSGYSWRILGIRIPVVYPNAVKLKGKGNDFIFYVPDRKTGEILIEELEKVK